MTPYLVGAFVVWIAADGTRLIEPRARVEGGTWAREPDGWHYCTEQGGGESAPWARNARTVGDSAVLLGTGGPQP